MENSNKNKTIQQLQWMHAAALTRFPGAWNCRDKGEANTQEQAMSAENALFTVFFRTSPIGKALTRFPGDHSWWPAAAQNR